MCGQKYNKNRDHIPKIKTMEKYIDEIVENVQDENQHILETGRILTEAEQRIARHSGVVHPEKIRLLELGGSEVPQIMERAFGAIIPGLQNGDNPMGKVLPAAMIQMMLHPVGVSLGYGVILNLDIIRSGILPVSTDQLKAHEFTHVGQIERMGLRKFTIAYLQEIDRYGLGPLEMEANMKMIGG